MRLLHVSNDHYPMVMGGTEIFVARLIEAQQRLRDGIDVRWASHLREGQDAGRNGDDGVQVHLPPVVAGDRLTSFTGSADAIPGFTELLKDFAPDVVHLHSFSQYCGLAHARAVEAVGARLVVTVHTPSYSCANGTLIDMNGSVCDGQLRPRRCTSCRLQHAGLPRPAAALSSIQRGLGLSVETEGRVAHVLTFRRLVEAFQGAWLELADLADAIHVHAEWLTAVIAGHGIPESKIHRVELAGPAPLPPRRRRTMEDGRLRLVYWGRCDQVKGIHIVVDAIRSLPTDAPVSLDIFTTGWERSYGQDLLRRIGHDPRFVRRTPLRQDAMVAALQDYDLAVVPSTWLETGPQTVLEAFAARLPVAGSPLGGIAELLHGVEGCFTVPTKPLAWSRLIRELVRNPTSLDAFQPPPSRTFENIARELLRRAYATVS